MLPTSLRKVTLHPAGLLVFLASFAFLTTCRAADNVAASESRLRETAAHLASDALEGRGVGTAGLDKAADYIASQFQQAGLRTNLFNGTPFQEFEITVAAQMGPGERNLLALSKPRSDDAAPGQLLQLGKDFRPLAVGGSGSFDAPLVFAGYGITAKDLKVGDQALTYDDYAGIDAQGKVVVIVRKEPQQKDPHSPFGGDEPSFHATFQQKLTNAAEHGAAAVIFVNDGQELVSRRAEAVKALQSALEQLAELRTKGATDGQWDQLAADIEKSATAAADASQTLQDADSLLPFTGAGEEVRRRNMPVFFATRAAIDPIIKAALGKDLAAIERQIDADLRPQSAALPGWRAQGEANIAEKKARVKNVVGVLEGAGPLAHETIVIGAHYDHLGWGGPGSLAPWTTEIHNGADDNASGTAVLLEMAHRLAAGASGVDDKPRRRIVFIAFTGEERNLLGSAHYTRQPRFPLENTVAMFNLDMVGRLTDDKLAVYGTGTAAEFEALVDRLTAEHGFQLTKHAGGFGPSDHSSFYAKKIPVLHLFTGSHADYHRPSDDAPKLNVAGMRRVADLLQALVQATDNTDARPTYVEIRRVEQLASAGEGDRPSFGSMPAYPNPAPDGVLLEAVMQGSAADQAGVKGGDVLQQLGDSKITILEDFESALRKHKPGDKVKVIVRRGDKKIETEATLKRRGGRP